MKRKKNACPRWTNTVKQNISSHRIITSLFVVKSKNTDSRQNAEQNILETIIRNGEWQYGLFSIL